MIKVKCKTKAIQLLLLQRIYTVGLATGWPSGQQKYHFENPKGRGRRTYGVPA